MANQSDVYYKEDAKCVLKSLLTSVPFANLILKKATGGSHGIVIQKMVDVTVFKFIVLKTIRGSLTPQTLILYFSLLDYETFCLFTFKID